MEYQELFHGNGPIRFQYFYLYCIELISFIKCYKRFGHDVHVFTIYLLACIVSKKPVLMMTSYTIHSLPAVITTGDGHSNCYTKLFSSLFHHCQSLHGVLLGSVVPCSLQHLLTLRLTGVAHQ